VGAFEAKTAVVHGVLSRSPAFLWQSFTPTEELFFQKDIPVEYKNPVHPPHLRIPASVWQKLEDENVKDLKKQQREKMRKALTETPSPLRLSCWEKPLRSKHVSEYASARTLPDGTTYHHSGLDLRAATGTPIHAMAEGEVTLAEAMIVPGNVVVIDHGGGIFSRYLHLSKILVTPGQHVARQEHVGDAGATGRVEASHLHWEVVWKTNPANPERFLKLWEQLCDPG
jgi:murein DD-endopeptidase MepM/ murein hydrolase activator NlpD